MATLLHIDSSVWSREGSASRDVAASFRAAWEAEHPEGTVIYRDLAADPLPHLDGTAAAAGFAPAEQHTPEQAEAFKLRDELARELEEADAVLIGAPMYNFSIPSTLKAWLDQVILMGRTMGGQTSVAGTPATVITSRGGGYAAGTPRESFEFAQSYLAKVLGEGGMGLDVHFIVPELTLAPSTPGMESLIEQSRASRAQAHEQAEARAKSLATRAAA
ncbi:NAD(P)H-dependent oxidoreductase [Streptomyces sp. ODS28]|uniref:FMN-dependent NADH-azoreductase n=1 Tax=Streptomyces sp. ODS28 TaxID=3136688 RepID=UPI0031ED2291